MNHLEFCTELSTINHILNNYRMDYKDISLTDGRKCLPQIIKEVEELGRVYVFTVHGKRKVAMVDFDLLAEFVENLEFGVSAKELNRRTKEERMSLDQLKNALNV